MAVIPAKAGIHNSHGMPLRTLWIPAFAGMTEWGGWLETKEGLHALN